MTLDLIVRRQLLAIPIRPFAISSADLDVQPVLQPTLLREGHRNESGVSPTISELMLFGKAGQDHQDVWSCMQTFVPGEGLLGPTPTTAFTIVNRL